MRRFSLYAPLLCCLLYACADSSPQPDEPTEQKDSVPLPKPMPEPADEANSDTVKANLWAEAKQYGRSVCLCGQKVFPIQEEKLASESPAMSDEQRTAHYEKFSKRLEPLRDDFQDCKAQAFSRFQDSSNYNENMLTRQQGDSLSKTIRAGFEEAGCGKFVRLSGMLFDKNQPLTYE